MPDATDQLSEWSKALAHAVESADIERIESPMTPTDTPNSHRRWLAVAASVLVIGAGIFAVATLDNDDPDQITPATNPPQTSVESTTVTTTSPTSTSPTTVFVPSGAQGALDFQNNSIAAPSVFGFDYGTELDPEAVIRTVKPRARRTRPRHRLASNA